MKGGNSNARNKYIWHLMQMARVVGRLRASKIVKLNIKNLCLINWSVKERLDDTSNN